MEGLEPEPQDYMSGLQLMDLSEVEASIYSEADELEPFIWGKADPVEWQGSVTLNAESLMKALGIYPDKKIEKAVTINTLEHRGIRYHFDTSKVVQDGDTISFETGPITFMD
jgi:hypothetical protein